MDWSKHFINGEWVAPDDLAPLSIVNPSNETTIATITLATAKVVDEAVKAAAAAFESWSATSMETRIGLVRDLLTIYNENERQLAQTMSLEMGAPIDFALEEQVGAGRWHIEGFLETISHFDQEEGLPGSFGQERIVREPIGVCGLITPWNWPMNQLTLKVIPALLMGCTIVLKPSEIAPLSSMLFADFLRRAGVPAGVFNLINGNGQDAGAALTGHEKVRMLSFTGSTQAGISVGVAAMQTMKRTALELGGKSPWIMFSDADLEPAIRQCVKLCMENTGQSCSAPTRLLVQQNIYNDVVDRVGQQVAAIEVDYADKAGPHIGPLVSQIQFDTVQKYIRIGLDEGAEIVTGGLGRPSHLDKGHFVRPTVFANAHNHMRIAREEIFGPVLTIIPFKDEAEAISISNDSDYGLAAYVSTKNTERAERVARKLKTGMVSINGATFGKGSPFGGCKLSGLGREGGIFGFEEFVEIKSIAM